jgi:drug/metabolite transporter (DMT)-like permease
MSVPISPGATSRGILLMMAAIALFTLMDALAKDLVARYPAPQIVWARFAGMLLLVLLYLRGRVPPLLRTRHPGWHAARAVTQLGATASFFVALGHIGLAEATALADINPVLITLGAAIFLGEKLGPRRIFGVLAAMAGALIILRPGFGVFTPWALLPLFGACCYAANALITRWIGPQESLWTAMLYASLIGTALAALALPAVWTPIAAADLPRFAAVGVLGMAAQLCIIRSFTLTEASVVAPFSYLGIIMATGWGYLFFGEVPDGPTILGALVIVLAGLYVWHRETRAARVTE